MFFGPFYYGSAAGQIRDPTRSETTMTDYSRCSDQKLQRKIRKKQAASKEVSVSGFRSIPDDKTAGSAAVIMLKWMTS
jgi:hypothetical protein